MIDNFSVEYPVISKGNPFDKEATGKYFAYLTNRKICFSHLSDQLEDFGFQNEGLYNAMPMGYTSLWVMERVSLKYCNEDKVFFNDSGLRQTCFYCKLKEGVYELVSQYEYMQLQKENTLPTIELCANIVDEYNWH